MNKEIEIADINEMKSFANKIAKLIKPKDIICLRGNLGAGKTTFCQFLIKSILGKDIEVTSPTFNLLHVYDGKEFSIWHFDLYRLKSREEIYEIGIEEALIDGVTIIEWPEIIIDILPKKMLDLSISFLDTSSTRLININGSNQWIEKLSKLNF